MREGQESRRVPTWATRQMVVPFGSGDTQEEQWWSGGRREVGVVSFWDLPSVELPGGHPSREDQWAA